MPKEYFSIRNYISITALLIVLVMTVLDVTVMNVTLPVIANDMGISDSLSVWVVTAYQLAITMLLLPVSSFGDIYSYKRTFLFGVTVFTISSILCGSAQNFIFLVIARTIQGIGGACIMGVNIALTRLIYPAEALGRGMALNAMVIAVSTAAGPSLAGGILSVASWHWIFFINVPLGVLAYILGARLLPENPAKRLTTKFDWVSGIENAVVFGLLFYALGNLSHTGNLPLNISLIAVGLIIAFFYVRRQRDRENPLLPVDLFRIRTFTLSICTSMCSFISQIMAMVSLPFLFLNKYGYSEVTTGLLMTPWPIMTMLTAPLSAHITERYNPGIVASAGMSIMVAGLISLGLLPPGEVGVWSIVWRMSICGIGFGLFQTPNNLVMVKSTPLKRTGGAGGMQSTARLIGQTTGSTLVSLIFAFTSSANNITVTLFTAASFALVSAIFSISRLNDKSAHS